MKNMQFKSRSFTEVGETWIVLYGEEDIDQRKERSFFSEKDAMTFYQKKKEEGVFVDLFRQRTTIETKKHLAD